ncbi:hypothetical protein [Paenibacillus ihumii]|uniref:hypothetical protein n=1 Tax=Paenibacillus ihumii TaxID=687436 RepID=UPI0006D80D61|nr:hypothetical protein [Paenibacillus ihumii]
MIEMREKEELKYSNAIPLWAKIVNRIFLIIFYLFGIAAIGLGILFLFGLQWFGAVVCLMAGAFAVWAIRLIGSSNKMYTEIVLKCELREEGYYTYLKKVKTGEEWEHIVAFDQMQEVLIARTSRYQSRGANRLGYHVVGAKIIMKWTNEQGETEYSLFGLEDRESLEEWIERFKQHGVPVYSSSANVSIVQVEDYQTGYAELPKVPHDSDTSSPVIGSRRMNSLKLWLSTGMKEKKRSKELRRDKRVFIPLWLAMLIGNLVITARWMPFWPLNGDWFGDDSPIYVLDGINFVLLLVVGAYWREQVKWYRSLRDAGLLLCAQLAGGLLAWLFGAAPAAMLGVLIYNGIVLAIPNGILFVIFRILRRFW